MQRYEIIPPGSSKRLWSWLAPGKQWGVVLIFSPWMFHVGLELWRYGFTFNIGPMGLGACCVRPDADTTRTNDPPREEPLPKPEGA